MNLLLIGLFPKDFDIKNVSYCMGFIGLKMFRALENVSDIHIQILDYAKNWHYLQNPDDNVTSEYHFKKLSDRGIVNPDITLYIGGINVWNKLEQLGVIRHIRKITKSGKIMSIMGLPIKDSDWSFCFLKPDNNSTLLNFVKVEEYNVVEKNNKSILIDHYWDDFLFTEKDMTFKIEDWVSDLYLKGYMIYRLYRSEEELKTFKSFEIPIKTCSFLEYLRQTDFIQNFIVTHYESFGWGIIDMTCRGIRVFAPPQFIDERFFKELNVKSFTNRDELLSAIQSPVQIVDYSYTSFDEIVSKVMNKAEEFMKLN